MSEWDELAPGWDDQAGVRAYAHAAHRSLLAHAADVGLDLDGLVVCDFGCGTGLLTQRLVDRAVRIDAVDSSHAMLDVLTERARHAGWDHVTTMAQLSDEPQGYDLIVCSSVLAFVDDVRATVEGLCAHLRPGGWLVHWDWERDSDDGEDSIGFTAGEVRAMLTGAGLQDVDVRTAFELDVDGHAMRPLMGTGRRPS